MGSSNFPNEEAVRQAWIDKMVSHLGYPRQLIAVEKQLSTLPHLLLTPRLPQRRLDLLVFGRDLHPDYPLYPLLMIEFKLGPLHPKFAEQVLGYNTYVKAPFVAIGNGEQLLIGAFNEEAGMTQFEGGLPRYETLLSAAVSAQVAQQHCLQQ